MDRVAAAEGRTTFYSGLIAVVVVANLLLVGVAGAAAMDPDMPFGSKLFSPLMAAGFTYGTYWVIQHGVVRARPDGLLIGLHQARQVAADSIQSVGVRRYMWTGWRYYPVLHLADGSVIELRLFETMTRREQRKGLTAELLRHWPESAVGQ